VQFDSLLDSLRPGGRDFERVCKWMLENVPEYRQRLRQVWLWDDWPGRWGRDAGIDLVAEDQDGGLWAVQAKKAFERDARLMCPIQCLSPIPTET
jgi:predicted helicase